MYNQVEVSYVSGTTLFTVPKRYANLSFLSAGAQGCVVRAENLETKEEVAIKKILHPFNDPLNARRTYREMVLLTTMKHPNIIELKDAFSPQQSLHNFKEIYLVTELMNYNLAQVIDQIKLDQKYISFLAYQMIVAIKYLHRSGIIHRDLKPSNVVVNSKCVLKILDFGLARKLETTDRMTNYVVTRYYRAPEVILGLPYDEKVDVWAIGCIIAEMVAQRVLFRGSDRLDQWTRIMEVLGTPDDDFLAKLDHHTRAFVRSKGFVEATPMEIILPDEYFNGFYVRAPQLNANSARDLISRMLHIDPVKRMSIDDAIRHPYVRLWYNSDEWNAPLPENRYDIKNDLTDRSLHEWKKLLFKEIKQMEVRMGEKTEVDRKE